MADDSILSARLSAAAQRFSFGQDTSRSYPRHDGKKAWRAEVPADEVDKEAGKDAAAELGAQFPLATLQLDAFHDAYVAAQKQRVSNGPAQHRRLEQQRLDEALAAAERRKQLKVVSRERFALSGCEDFITYVHGERHGTRTKMRVKPRAQPYDIGKVSGATLTLTPAALHTASMPRTPSTRVASTRMWRQMRALHQCTTTFMCVVSTSPSTSRT